MIITSIINCANNRIKIPKKLKYEFNKITSNNLPKGEITEKKEYNNDFLAPLKILFKTLHEEVVNNIMF